MLFIAMVLCCCPCLANVEAVKWFTCTSRQHPPSQRDSLMMWHNPSSSTAGHCTGCASLGHCHVIFTHAMCELLLSPSQSWPCGELIMHMTCSLCCADNLIRLTQAGPTWQGGRAVKGSDCIHYVITNCTCSYPREHCMACSGAFAVDGISTAVKAAACRQRDFCLSMVNIQEV